MESPAAPHAGPHVLVVAYGAPDDLAVSLTTLGGLFAVTVVDNSSSPACQAVVERAGADYVDAGANRGFAAGVNRGLEQIGRPGPDVLLLNPDAAIDAAGVTALHARLRSLPRAAAAAPALIGPDGTAQRVRWPFPSPARMWAEAVGLSRLSRLGDHPGQGFLVGAVLLLRAEALEEIGPFDERFFLYAEETDWQRRAAAAGWEVAFCPEIVARHRGAGTSADPALREARFHCGTETYVRKWHGAAGWQSYRAAALAAALLRTLRPAPEARRLARRRAVLYARGPCRGLMAPSTVDPR
jgi:GT2 family glycosyltransferase